MLCSRLTPARWRRSLEVVDEPTWMAGRSQCDAREEHNNGQQNQSVRELEVGLDEDLISSQ